MSPVHKGHALREDGHATLTIHIQTKRNGLAVASLQYCVSKAGCGMHVVNSWDKNRQAATPAKELVSDSNSLAVTAQRHCLHCYGSDLLIDNSLLKLGQVTLAGVVAANSHSPPVTTQEHRVVDAGRDLLVHHTLREFRHTALAEAVVANGQSPAVAAQ